MENLDPGEDLSREAVPSPSSAAISKAASILVLILERIARDDAEAAHRATLEPDALRPPDEPVTG